MIALDGKVKGGGRMVLSFLIGLLGARWWWPALVAIAGLAFDWLILKPRSMSWRREAGLSDPGATGQANVPDIIFAVALALVLAYLAYWLGLVLRYYSTDWLRLYRDRRSRNTAED